MVHRAINKRLAFTGIPGILDDKPEDKALRYFNFEDNPVIREQLQKTRNELRGVGEACLRIELSFWIKAVEVEGLFPDGLNVALRRIHSLKGHLKDAPVSAEAAAKKAETLLHKLRAIEQIGIARSASTKKARHTSIAEVRRRLRKGGLTPASIGSSENELRKLRRS